MASSIVNYTKNESLYWCVQTRANLKASYEYDYACARVLL